MTIILMCLTLVGLPDALVGFSYSTSAMTSPLVFFWMPCPHLESLSFSDSGISLVQFHHSEHCVHSVPFPNHITEFVKKPSLTACWLKYYTDKTKPIEKTTSKHPPITISINEMINFIKLTSVNSKHIIVPLPERCHFKSRAWVRVIDGTVHRSHRKYRESCETTVCICCH